MDRTGRTIVAGAVAVIVGLAAGCGERAVDTSAEVPDAVGEQAAEAADDGVELVVQGRTLLLRRAAGDVELAVLRPEDGEVVHAVLRPGDGPRHVAVVLTALPGDTHPRYELRYVVADVQTEAAAGADVTDLYWFPWRLQVADDLAAVHDVPPLPVWAPDGSALAWIEWDETTTRLRTVGWYDDGAAANPSDETTTHRLVDVPPGVQLESWLDVEERLVLIARGGQDERYRIEVEL